MARSFLAVQVSDLCVGKPPLTSLPATATAADAVSALKRSGEINVGVWSCNHSDSTVAGNDVVSCRCIGKICMVDVIVYLCKEENLRRPFEALQTSVLDLVPEAKGKIKHLEPNSSLLEAIDYILEGAQNLVIPIQKANQRPKHDNLGATPTHHNGKEFCWLTQEDVIRYLLNSIRVFSQLPTLTIEALNIVDTKTLTVHYDDPASLALPSITRSHLDQTSIAVVNHDNTLIGEISPFTLSCCDLTMAPAVATLSAGELMAFIDYNGPPEDLVHLVKKQLADRNLVGMLDLMDGCNNNSLSCLSSSSSDEEFGYGRTNGGMRRSYPGRRSEAIVCHPWNSLMAVMVQMIAHRVGYAWVVKEDYGLVGIVSFRAILKQFRSVLEAWDNNKRKEEKMKMW